jgi:hypothetical protein
MKPCKYGHAYVTARVYKIRVLPKHKPTLKSQIKGKGKVFPSTGLGGP